MTEIRIERLGHHGDGLADGPIFAPRTLPGEVVTGDLEGDRLCNVKVLHPSDERVKPGCPAYNRCGGCSLHHASDGFVENWKSEFVESALAAQGIKCSVRNFSQSPPKTRRRVKFTGTRTKKFAVVGFLGRDKKTIQNIDGCLVITNTLNSIIPFLEEFTHRFSSRKARLSFWCLETQTGIDVAVDGLGDVSKTELEAMASLAGATGIARLTVGDDTVMQSTAPKIVLGNVSVEPPARTFTQATLHGECALQKSVHEAVLGAKNVVDLFSGIGTLSLPLAKFVKVDAFEVSRDSCLALDLAVKKADGLKEVNVYQRDLFRRPLDDEELNKYGAAIIDPARAGAEEQTKWMARSNLDRIALVSCNPVTLARDLKILLDAGFALSWLDVIDQFRWTTHTEVVAFLQK